MGNHSRGKININGNALADFFEVHSLFICNTAFQHSPRHKTTWQGQRRDAATGQVVPMYNVIYFVICRHTHTRLLVDSRTCAATLRDTDHRLLTAKIDITQLYNVLAASRRCARQSVFGITPACQLTNPTEQSSATPSRRRYQKSTRTLQPAKDGVRWKIS